MTTEAPVSRRRLTLATALQMLSRVLGAFLGVLVAASLARSLTRSDFGKFSLALTIVTIAGSITDLGLNQIAIREMAQRPEQRGRIAGALTVTRLLMSLLLAAVGLGVAFALMHGATARAMSAFVVATLPVGALGAASLATQARLRPELYVLPSLVQSIVWLVVVLLLAAAGAGLAAYGIGLLAADVVQSFVTIALARRVTAISVHGSIGLIRRLMREAWPLGLAGMCVSAYYKIDALLLFNVRGATATAYYSASYRFIDVLQLLPVTVSGVMLPLATGLQREGQPERSARIYEFAVVMLVATALPVVVCGIILAPSITHLIYGAKYDRSIVLLRILLPAFIPICLGYMVTSQLILHGRLRTYAAVTGGAAVLNIGVNIIGLPRYGAPFAAWATLGTEALVVIATGTIARRSLAVQFPLMRSLRCALALIPTGLLVWLVRDQTLILAGLVVVLTYPLGLWAARAVSPADIKSVLSARSLVKA